MSSLDAINSYPIMNLQSMYSYQHLLDWYIGNDKSNDIDSNDKKRKTLTMTVNFHKNSDIDRFNMPRKLGSRGIKEIMT